MNVIVNFLKELFRLHGHQNSLTRKTQVNGTLNIVFSFFPSLSLKCLAFEKNAEHNNTYITT